MAPADPIAPVREGEPISGWYKRRLVRGGPWVPARIWWQDGDRDPETGELMSDDVLRCEVNGKEVDPFKEWLWIAGHPISEADYKLMMAKRDWDAKHDPAAPSQEPTTKLDPLLIRPLF